MRPRLFVRFGVGSCLLFLIVAHADLFTYCLSMLGRHQPGIEADWSCPPWLFRNFSLKLVGLTAPQHALSLSLLALYLSFPYILRKKAGGAAVILEGLFSPGLSHLIDTVRVLFCRLFRLWVFHASAGSS